MASDAPGPQASNPTVSTLALVVIASPMLVVVAASAVVVVATVPTDGATAAPAGDVAPLAAGDVTPLAAGDVSNADANEPRRSDASLTGCFLGEGYPLSIGNGSATMDAVVHVSVLTDPTAGNEFGVELAGSLDRDPLVTLAAGVRFDAPGLAATGVNPFSAFDLIYAYELRLPMFDGAIGDSDHREDRPPVGSAAGTVSC